MDEDKYTVEQLDSFLRAAAKENKKLKLEYELKEKELVATPRPEHTKKITKQELIEDMFDDLAFSLSLLETPKYKPKLPPLKKDIRKIIEHQFDFKLVPSKKFELNHEFKPRLSMFPKPPGQ